MGKKGPMKSFRTVDDYIASQPEEAQGILKELRSIIHNTALETVEIPD